MNEGMLSNEYKIRWWMIAFGFFGYKLFRCLSWKSLMLLSTGAIVGGSVENPRKRILIGSITAALIFLCSKKKNNKKEAEITLPPLPQRAIYNQWKWAEDIGYEPYADYQYWDSQSYGHFQLDEPLKQKTPKVTAKNTTSSILKKTEWQLKKEKAMEKFLFYIYHKDILASDGRIDKAILDEEFFHYLEVKKITFIQRVELRNLLRKNKYVVSAQRKSDCFVINKDKLKYDVHNSKRSKFSHVQ